MADDPVEGIYLITIPVPPGAPAEGQPVAPGTASVTFHRADGEETLEQVANRVADQSTVGCRLLAIDAADAVELRMNPGIERVDPPAP